MYGTRRLEETIPGRAGAAVGFDDRGFALKQAVESGEIRFVKTASVDDVFDSVLVDETTNATTGAVENGQLIDRFLHGIVPVKAIAGTYVHNEKVYLSQTAEADGHVKNSDANSATFVGRYVGPDAAVYETGDLIEVDLDGRA